MSPQESIAHYRITAKLGEGGMGAVYRATDTKLNRDVAVKMLPDAFRNDASRMARFEREAQVLASLNHPNIAAIYGIEQGAIVMELVEGEDLRGPVPIETALNYARQIAAGMEAAHERGIVHRDLKPANIKVTPDGVVKLLDFGLAKATEEPAGASSARSPTMSPTLSMAMTQAGMILGTPAYMSPEQARGKPVDKRADIWAFGVILYEMLTGTSLFGGGEAVSDSLAAVITREPDLAPIPEQLRPLLKACLEKDPRNRLRDIGDWQRLLVAPSVSSVAPARRSLALPLALSAIIVVLLAAIVSMRRPGEEAQPLKLSVLPPEGASFSVASVPAISPDGRHLAFTAVTPTAIQLWVRDLNSMTARPIAGTSSANDPFWSPDSRFIAFFANGKLKKVDLLGGPAFNICDSGQGRGGSWNKNDVILFAPNGGSPLMRIPASGGTASMVGSLDEKAGEVSHRFPWFLPDGRHYLLTIRNAEPEKTAIFVADLESKARHRLVNASSNGAYAAPGYLLFLHERTLIAQPFDAAALRLHGDRVPVAEQVDYVGLNIQGQFTVSQNGLLAVNAGRADANAQVTWVDRAGKELEKVGPRAVISNIALSPNDSRVAIEQTDPQTGTPDIWLHDLAHGTGSRFTFDPNYDVYPVWSPDASQVLFASNRAGPWGLYLKPANGVGNEELALKTGQLTNPTDWSPDGRLALYELAGQPTNVDIWAVPMQGERKPFPVVQSNYADRNGRFSMDGRYIAYDSGELGGSNPDIFVQTFPGKEGKWQISTNGGSRPVWSRDGKELFYIAGDNKIMAVEVKTGAKFEHGLQKALFPIRTAPSARFEVSRDGKRFLIVDLKALDNQPPMTLLLNWYAGLRK